MQSQVPGFTVEGCQATLWYRSETSLRQECSHADPAIGMSCDMLLPPR